MEVVARRRFSVPASPAEIDQHGSLVAHDDVGFPDVAVGNAGSRQAFDDHEQVAAEAVEEARSDKFGDDRRRVQGKIAALDPLADEKVTVGIEHGLGDGAASLWPATPPRR